MPFDFFRRTWPRFQNGETNLFFFVNAEKHFSNIDSSLDFARRKTFFGLRIICWTTSDRALAYVDRVPRLKAMTLVEISAAEVDRMIGKTDPENRQFDGFQIKPLIANY